MPCSRRSAATSSRSARQNALEPEPLEPIKSAQDSDTTRPTEFNVSLHGETYHIRVTGSGHPHQDQRPFYLTVDGVPEEILVESLEEVEVQPTPNGAAAPRPSKGSKRPRATKPGHVTTSMPGTIVEVLVKSRRRCESRRSGAGRRGHEDGNRDPGADCRHRHCQFMLPRATA